MYKAFTLLLRSGGFLLLISSFVKGVENILTEEPIPIYFSTFSPKLSRGGCSSPLKRTGVSFCAKDLFF
jgi:hypothetical protein